MITNVVVGFTFLKKKTNNNRSINYDLLVFKMFSTYHRWDRRQSKLESCQPELQRSERWSTVLPVYFPPERSVGICTEIFRLQHSMKSYRYSCFYYYTFSKLHERYFSKGSIYYFIHLYQKPIWPQVWPYQSVEQSIEICWKFISALEKFTTHVWLNTNVFFFFFSFFVNIPKRQYIFIRVSDSVVSLLRLNKMRNNIIYNNNSIQVDF